MYIIIKNVNHWFFFSVMNVCLFRYFIMLYRKRNWDNMKLQSNVYNKCCFYVPTNVKIKPMPLNVSICCDCIQNLIFICFQFRRYFIILAMCYIYKTYIKCFSLAGIIYVVFKYLVKNTLSYYSYLNNNIYKYIILKTVSINDRLSRAQRVNWTVYFS